MNPKRIPAASRRAGALVLMLCLTGVMPGLAQRWQWPEHPENLKVLPEDTSPEQLRNTMIGFVRALDVRCSHCHDDSEAKSFEEIDFASDAKEAKKKARVMMRMVKAINGEHLAELGPDRMAVTCVTCHRGNARPRMLADELGEALDEDGVAGMVARYRDLREAYYGGFTYDFSEDALLDVARTYAGADNLDAAEALLRLDLEYHPASASAYAGLGEVYTARQDTALARAYFLQALVQDPGDRRARARLNALDNQ